MGSEMCIRDRDGDPRELHIQIPAQSAKDEERGDRERNPWLAMMQSNQFAPTIIKGNIHPILLLLLKIFTWEPG